jgi:hypothetical protein
MPFFDVMDLPKLGFFDIVRQLTTVRNVSRFSPTIGVIIRNNGADGNPVLLRGSD